MLLLHMPYTIINAATAKSPLVAGAATVGTVVDSFIANFFSFFFSFSNASSSGHKSYTGLLCISRLYGLDSSIRVGMFVLQLPLCMTDEDGCFPAVQ